MKGLSVLFASVLVLLSLHSGYSKIPLYILSLQELTNIPYWYDSNTLIPGIVDLTLERINNHTDLLEDYELKVVQGDVQVMQFEDSQVYKTYVYKCIIILYSKLLFAEINSFILY